MPEPLEKTFTINFGICESNDVLYPEAIQTALIDNINANPLTMPIVSSVAAVKHGFAIDQTQIIGAIKSAKSILMILDKNELQNNVEFTCDLAPALADVKFEEFQLTPIGLGVIKTVDEVPTYTVFRPMAFTFTPKTKS